MPNVQKVPIEPAPQPDVTMFGARKPFSGSQLADAVTTLRNIGRSQRVGKEKVAYEIEQIISTWESQ